jgi:hypothetical protein
VTRSWFQPLNLKCDILVSKFAFKCNLTLVSGKVVDGWSVLDKVEAAAVAAGGVSEEPTVPVVVADCGLL